MSTKTVEIKKTTEITNKSVSINENDFEKLVLVLFLYTIKKGVFNLQIALEKLKVNSTKGSILIYNIPLVFPLYGSGINC